MPRSKTLEQRTALLSPKKRALFEERLRGKSRRGAASNPSDHQDQMIPQRPPGTSPPLSLAQERLWRFSHRHPESVVHNLHYTIALDGVLNASALERSGKEIVRRHEALRSRFPPLVEAPVALVNSAPEFPCKRVDLLTISPTRQRDEMMERLHVEGRRPFDLSQGPLLRALLFTLRSDHHILVLLMHHLVIDGWSLRLLVRELATLYGAFSRGAPSPFEEPRLQYGDFTRWQHENLNKVRRHHQEFWQRFLADCPRQSTLPPDRSSSVDRRSGAGYQMPLSFDLTTALEDFARQQRSTLFMVLLAAFGALLSRRTGQEDLVLGTPTAGRPHEMLQELVGFFVNILVLRLDLAGNPTFLELLHRVRQMTLEAYEHQETPFETLTALVEAPEETSSPNSSSPLVQITLNLPPVGTGKGAPIKAGGVTFDPLFTHDMGSEFDLSLYAVPGPHGLHLHFAYQPTLFSERRIARLAEDLKRLLMEVVDNPRRQLSEYLLSIQFKQQTAAP